MIVPRTRTENEVKALKWKLGEECITAFNFDMVHSYMHLATWKWHNNDAVPTVEQLKSAVNGMLYSLASGTRDCTRIRQGGFTLSYWTWDAAIEVTLDFCMESASRQEGRLVE
jgi:hypothetical protein